MQIRAEWARIVMELLTSPQRPAQVCLRDALEAAEKAAQGPTVGIKWLAMIRELRKRVEESEAAGAPGRE